MKEGDWITRVTQLNQEIMDQAEVPGKIEGTIVYLSENLGFIRTDEGGEYFFSQSAVISTDKNKSLIVGKRLKFYPVKFDDSNFAMSVEVLS